jgi:hypothetical protein
MVVSAEELAATALRPGVEEASLRTPPVWAPSRGIGVGRHSAAWELLEAEQGLALVGRGGAALAKPRGRRGRLPALAGDVLKSVMKKGLGKQPTFYVVTFGACDMLQRREMDRRERIKR